MAELYSQYTSGAQFTTGAIAGSANGVSGLNPIVDRLNSISTSNNLVTGSVISGAGTNIITAYQNGHKWTGSLVSGTNTNIVTKYQSGHSWTGSFVSGTNLKCVVGNHGTASAPEVVNVVYGTSSTPPSASTVTEGTLYIEY